MADQEFLTSFAVEIDEGGVSRLQEILSQNRELAEELAEAFSAATEAIQAFRDELGSIPVLFFRQDGYGRRVRHRSADAGAEHRGSTAAAGKLSFGMQLLGLIKLCSGTVYVS